MKFKIILLIILLMPQVMAFGILETPRIGLNLNLSETNFVSTKITTSNPTNDILNVTLELQDFIEIERNESIKDIEINPFLERNESIKDIEINPFWYILNPNQTKTSTLEITLSEPGKYEGGVSVIFQKSNSTQKSILNSVIQVNAFEDDEKSYLWLWIMIAIILVFIAFYYVLIKE